MPLASALKQAVESRGGELVVFHRDGARGGTLSLRVGDHYKTLSAAADESARERGAIDDSIYDRIVEQLEGVFATSAISATSK